VYIKIPMPVFKTIIIRDTSDSHTKAESYESKIFCNAENLSYTLAHSVSIMPKFSASALLQ
jgi:hypothetical protein